MTKTLPLIDPSEGNYAFFFDVDGTLAELQPEPDAVTIPDAVRAHLNQLAHCCQQAVALVSGRPITQLDKLIAPLHLPVAGIHGAERRDSQDNIWRLTIEPATVSALAVMLENTLQTLPGILLEKKALAFALHYRQAPHYQQQVIQLANEAVARFPQFSLQPGNCVVELKPQGVDKGKAIHAFMQERPFMGRQPVFIGDDLTDEKGFTAVNELNGISIKVGERSDEARYAIGTVAEVYHWLEQLLHNQNKITSVRS